MPEYSLEVAFKNIEFLNQERIAQLNRQLAQEALLRAMLAELDLAVLEALEESYDLRVLNGMQQLEPEMQREHLWTQYLDKIRELIAARKKDGRPYDPLR